MQGIRWKLNYGRKTVSKSGCYSMNFGYVHQRYHSGMKLSKCTLDDMDTYNKLKNLIQNHDPSFSYSTIVVNKNLRCNKHVDKMNKGLSWITACGDYTGGQLRVYKGGGNDTEYVDHDIHDKWLLFDGQNPHETLPFTGNRFVVIYCTHQNWNGVPSNVPNYSEPSDICFPNRGIKLKMHVRPETTDEKVIDEVLNKNVYEKPKLGFVIQSGERWLDLGANIGTFSLLALSRGAEVYACEPEPNNLKILENNLDLNFNDYLILPYAITSGKDKYTKLYVCSGDYNKYRHTVYPKRGRKAIQVPQYNIRDLLRDIGGVDGIKMDIEGAEIDILEYLTPDDYMKNGVRKLVFEYSFDIDPSIPRFLAIVKSLREYFDVVEYSKVKEDELEYRHFPAATLVFCQKN